jgi:hypothetical protein
VFVQKKNANGEWRTDDRKSRITNSDARIQDLEIPVARLRGAPIFIFHVPLLTAACRDSVRGFGSPGVPTKESKDKEKDKDSKVKGSANSGLNPSKGQISTPTPTPTPPAPPIPSPTPTLNQSQEASPSPSPNPGRIKSPRKRDSQTKMSTNANHIKSPRKKNSQGNIAIPGRRDSQGQLRGPRVPNRNSMGSIPIPGKESSQEKVQRPKVPSRDSQGQLQSPKSSGRSHSSRGKTASTGETAEGSPVTFQLGVVRKSAQNQGRSISSPRGEGK